MWLARSNDAICDCSGMRKGKGRSPRGHRRQIVVSSLGHCEHFDFYSEWGGKPLEVCEQRYDIILDFEWSLFLDDELTIGLETRGPYRTLLQQSRQGTKMAWTGLDQGGSSRGGRMRLDSECFKNRVREKSQGPLWNFRNNWNEMGKTAAGKIRNSALGTLCFRIC